MPTYYAEFAFRGKKVVKIDANSREEALKIAQETMDSSHGPASGLTVESFWSNFDKPRLVDGFSERVRRQSERLRDICNVYGRSVLSDIPADKAPSTQQNRSTVEGHTYYFRIPLTGEAVLQITAEGEEQAQIAARSAVFSLAPKLDGALISYSIRREDPVMVEPDLS